MTTEKVGNTREGEGIKGSDSNWGQGPTKGTHGNAWTPLGKIGGK